MPPLPLTGPGVGQVTHCPIVLCFDAALVEASDPWTSSLPAPFLGACENKVNSVGTGMGWVAAAAVGGFVLRAQLSELWFSLAVVFGD